MCLGNDGLVMEQCADILHFIPKRTKTSNIPFNIYAKNCQAILAKRSCKLVQYKSMLIMEILNFPFFE